MCAHVYAALRTLSTRVYWIDIVLFSYSAARVNVCKIVRLFCRLYPARERPYWHLTNNEPARKHGSSTIRKFISISEVIFYRRCTRLKLQKFRRRYCLRSECRPPRVLHTRCAYIECKFTVVFCDRNIRVRRINA